MGGQTRDWEKYQNLCRRLRQAREEAGLTQEEAARLLGRPQWFVSRSETGARRLDLIELANLARVYRKPLSFFTKGIVD
jgi:transcriptional regulator with XRE-family HTH domain